MSIEVEILCETFNILKEYVPSKDRQASADHVFSIINDLEISERDLKAFCQCDPYLQKAYAEYFDDSDLADEDSYDYDDLSD